MLVHMHILYLFFSLQKHMFHQINSYIPVYEYIYIHISYVCMIRSLFAQSVSRVMRKRNCYCRRLFAFDLK